MYFLFVVFQYEYTFFEKNNKKGFTFIIFML